MAGWFYLKEGWIEDTEQGPFNDESFYQLAFDGSLKTTAKIRHPLYTNNQWALLANVPDIARRLQAGIESRKQARTESDNQRRREKQAAKDKALAEKQRKQKERVVAAQAAAQAEAEYGWYVFNQERNSRIGPMDDGQLRDYASRGLINTATQVLHPTHTGRQWVQASSVASAMGLVIGGPFIGAAQFRCPYCQTGLPPAIHSQISGAGWIIFILLFFLLCWPLCWIGLLIKEEYRVCQSCGMKLG